MKARNLRAAVSIAGWAVIGAAVLSLPPSGEPMPAWLQRLPLFWGVLVPLWWWIEYRLFFDPAEADDFKYQQMLSRQVWLGFLIGMSVLVLLAG